MQEQPIANTIEPGSPRDRARGALVGLAAGDAVGTTLEFQPPGCFEPLTDMVGGGPFHLRPGQWTDDTSMALCLAESLLDRGGHDGADQLRRYVLWWKEGYLSSTGRCFDIGITTKKQLERFLRTGDPEDRRIDDEAAANGSLMRLAPVSIRWSHEPEAVVEQAAASSRTTHAARRPVDACRLLAAMTAALIRGESAEEVPATDCRILLWGVVCAAVCVGCQGNQVRLLNEAGHTIPPSSPGRRSAHTDSLTTCHQPGFCDAVSLAEPVLRRSIVKPKLFVASSIEARSAALRIRDLVEKDYEVEVWTEGFFQPGASTFSSIANRIRDFDGGIFILSPDDEVQSRGRQLWAPRSNVLFELGMFAGVLGIGNCIQVVLKVSSNTPSANRFAVELNSCDQVAMSGTSGIRVDLGNIVVGCFIGSARAKMKTSRQIDAITDLAGITWIEARAQSEVIDARTTFRLTDQGEKAIVKAFNARARRDSLTLSALRSSKRLTTQWFHMGEEIPGKTELVAFGDRVRAEFEWKGVGRKYQISLRFEAEDRLSGEWWDCTERGYGGTASFQIRQQPPYMLGAWVGWSTNGGVKSGAIVIVDEENKKRATIDRLRVSEAHELPRRTRGQATKLHSVDGRTKKDIPKTRRS